MSAFLYTPCRQLYCLHVKGSGVENGKTLKRNVASYCVGIPPDDLHVIYNGRLVHDDVKLHLRSGDVCHAVLCLPGGKGGFGSMLRAIGAQIEKTTNREACRDLSGRRMRDINDEKKIAEWVSKQAEREREKARQKQQRLEKRYALQKHTFDDQSYTQNIQENSERVEDALQQGLRAVSSSSTPSLSNITGQKRAHPNDLASSTVSKKRGTWLGMDDLDVDEDESEDILSEPNTKTETSTCSSTVTCTTSSPDTCTTERFESQRETATQVHLSKTVVDELAKETGECVTDMRETEDMSASQASSEHSSNQNRSLEYQVAVELSESKGLCLDDFSSAEDLECFGLEHLKEELMAKGLKCGGTLKQRAQRLFATKGVPMDQLDPSLFAKPTNGKKSNGKSKK